MLGFRRGCLVGIPDHVAIDDHAETIREPGCHSRSQDKQNKERLREVLDRESSYGCDKQDGHGHIKGCDRSGITPQIGMNLGPESLVGAQYQEQCDQDAQRNTADFGPVEGPIYLVLFSESHSLPHHPLKVASVHDRGIGLTALRATLLHPVVVKLAGNPWGGLLTVS